MSLVPKIKSGQLSKQAFYKQLADYKRKKNVLELEKRFYLPELFDSKMKEFDISITFCQLFIDNFEKIAKDNIKLADKIV